MAMKTYRAVQRAAESLRKKNPDLSTGLSLLRACPKGTTVYTILRKVSASGMLRTIDVRVILPDPSGSENGIAVLCIRVPEVGKRYAKDIETARRWGGDFRVHGIGMDMGFDLVDTLSRLAHGESNYFVHRWL